MTATAHGHADVRSSLAAPSPIVVLTPNPAIDVSYRVADQRLGETVRVQHVERHPGGKGLNVARVLHVVGREAVAVQPLGGDSGRWVHDALALDGIASVAVPVSAATRSTVAVIDDRRHPTLLSEPGSPLSGTEWRRLRAAVGTRCEPGGMLIVSGSFPPGTTEADVAGIVATAHEAGSTVLVDTSGPALVWSAKAGADILKPNEAELREATGEHEIETAARWFLEHGVSALVVSRGAAGISRFDADGDHDTVPAIPGVTGNPTGAGDAATAGLAAALTVGRPLAEAVRLASLLGAAAVCAPTAGTVSIEQIAELFRRLPHDDRPADLAGVLPAITAAHASGRTTPKNAPL